MKNWQNLPHDVWQMGFAENELMANSIIDIKVLGINIINQNAIFRQPNYRFEPIKRTCASSLHSRTFN